ncbi:MAG TPA: ribosome maturation factor RimP [Myxococcota bacterium]|nr:ribosome maturation factor RimP [Myxococcota bacterium]
MEEFVIELSPEEELLRQVIEPLLESEGFELIRIRLKKSRVKSILAIFIDTLNRKNGVVLENLSDMSRFLSDVLDANFAEGAILRGRYDLEVSSPGLDRPLSKPSHFKDAVGEKIKLRLKLAHESGAKNLGGVLREVTREGVIVEPDHMKEENLSIFYRDMAEAHVVFDFTSLDTHKTAKAGK